jgi:hypothetical protein
MNLKHQSQTAHTRRLVACLGPALAALLLPLSVGAQFTDNTGTNVIANGASGTASALVYDTTGYFGRGFYALNSGTIWGLDDVSITTSGQGAHGFYATGSSAVIAKDRLRITVSGTLADGIAVDAGSLVRIGNNATINVSGERDTRGIATSGRVWAGDNLTINMNAPSGNDSGIYAAATTAYVEVGRNARIINASPSAGLFWGLCASTGTIVVGEGLVITAVAENFLGIAAGGDTGFVTVGANASITGSGTAAQGVWVVSGGNVQLDQARLEITDGRGLVVEGGEIILTDSEVTAGTGIHLIKNNLSGGVLMTGGTMTATSGAVINVTGSGTGNRPVNVTGAAFLNSGTGGLLANDGLDGLVEVEITQSDLSNAGGLAIGAGNDGVTNVTVNGGSGFRGDITNSGSGTLALELNASSLTGDVTNGGDGTLTINLDNASAGAGGFTGGVLNIRDTASRWTFAKNSTPDRIDNHGVIHVGGHGNYIAVHSDSISGNGTWYFPVDSDTGAKSTVTGSTATTSHPHGKIDAIGDGYLELKTVTANLVTGKNKENWIWDDFNWGLEKYTQDDHDSDGNPHFTQQGASPAGAVFNSAVVLQQAMWSAQNDSLAKRLGDLRLADLSDRADRTDRSDRTDQPDRPDRSNQPHNTAALWMRAYAQHLNLDAEVAGHRFTQQL